MPREHVSSSDISMVCSGEAQMIETSRVLCEAIPSACSGLHSWTSDHEVEYLAKGMQQQQTLYA